MVAASGYLLETNVVSELMKPKPNRRVVAWIEAMAKRQRLTIPTIDAQLAATALHHGLTFATRNTTPVRHVAVAAFNPWSDD